MNKVQLDLDFSRKARDKGIQKAQDSADGQTPSWSDRAFVILKEFIDLREGEFMAEELRKFAYEQCGLPQPPSERAWGGVLRRASAHDLILVSGTRPVSNVKAHMAFARLWKRA